MRPFNSLHCWAAALRGLVNHTAFRPQVILLAGIVCGSRVLRTDAGCELLVAPLLVVLLHFLEGVANGRP